ncbi:hypothetical protein AB6N30_08310 [Fusobacterium animalis]|nr:hypothetical protein [Fusobacterium nucleatum]
MSKLLDKNIKAFYGNGRVGDIYYSNANYNVEYSMDKGFKLTVD